MTISDNYNFKGWLSRMWSAMPGYGWVGLITWSVIIYVIASAFLSAVQRQSNELEQLERDAATMEKVKREFAKIGTSEAVDRLCSAGAERPRSSFAPSEKATGPSLADLEAAAMALEACLAVRKVQIEVAKMGPEN